MDLLSEIIASTNSFRNQDDCQSEYDFGKLCGTCTKQMMACNQRNKRRLDPISPSELPLDSIVEILSWLPVESLLRFKCVCKHWCSLIQDYQFVLKHVDRTNPMSLFYPCKSDESFEFVSSFAGFCMEKSVSDSRIFRIRNPATHQVLSLPDAPPHTITVDFAINSSTGECKVLCVYWEKIRKNIDAKFGFKVITVGIDEQWRPVELPDQNKLPNKWVLRGRTTAVDKDEGVCHLLQTVSIIDDEGECYMEVQSFDLWSESFTTNTVPQGVFSDFSQVGFFPWHNCLSICQIKENAYNLLVLEDYKKHKWGKNKIIIPLRLPNELLARLKNLNLNRQVVAEELYLHISGVNYNMTYVGKPKNSMRQCLSGTGEILHKPSLMTLKGMIPENGYNAKKEVK